MEDKRGFIVWGTGMAGKRLLARYGDLNIIHVVDGNIQKKGQEFAGYVIEAPDDIKDWSEYRVIVASEYYDEIKVSLEERGLTELRDYGHYKNVVNFYTIQELERQIDVFLDKIREIGTSGKPKRLLLGNLVGDHQKNGSCYLNRMAKIDREHQWIFLLEAPFEMKEEWFDSMQILTLPCVFAHNQRKENTAEDEISPAMFDEELHNAALAMLGGAYATTIEYTDWVTRKAYDFYRQILEILKPDKAYSWSNLFPLHRVFAKACCDAGTEIIYPEIGILPGTVTFDKHGDLGESTPAVFFEEFQQIDVKPEEKEHARQVISFLHESGLNRYEQRKDKEFMDALQSRLLPDRPIILFAGQLDHFAGMIPHNEWGVRYHSPIFETSETAAVYLRELAKKKQWNLIFKSHPWLPSQIPSDDSGFQCINSGNINDIIDICDLVITIVSTTSYVALIRNKPVLMLGYMHLKHKGCTYEAFQENEIERTIEEALEKGFQPEMKEAFVEHVARLEKSYLYDDMSEKAVRIGKSFEQAVREGEIL